MKLKIRILTMLGSLMVMAFAVNLGIASADPGHYEGGNEADGINTAAEAGAYAPVGSALGAPTCDIDNPPDCHPGLVNGFDFGNGPGGSTKPNTTNPAVIGLTHNPLCPLHPGQAH